MKFSPLNIQVPINCAGLIYFPKWTGLAEKKGDLPKVTQSVTK